MRGLGNNSYSLIILIITAYTMPLNTPRHVKIWYLYALAICRILTHAGPNTYTTYHNGSLRCHFKSHINEVYVLNRHKIDKNAQLGYNCSSANINNILQDTDKTTHNEDHRH